MNDRDSFQRHIPAVANYRLRLASLQGAWDTLGLLSYLGENGANLESTRQAFDALAAELLTHLAAESRKKAELAAKARAQVAIDILVRNLFERTADVGFLAADDDLVQFAGDVARLDATERREATARIQARLAEYVAKYSVYDNVVLVAPGGEVLAQLAGGGAPDVTRDPLIGTTLNATSFVETFSRTDLVPGAARALVYSQRVVSGSQVLGVLCLCFALEDECAGIYGRLLGANDWTVLALVDEHDVVISSSDPHQVPAGAHVAVSEGGAGIVRFAGREYLAITCPAAPYQGYVGPPWRGHAMVPLNHAFESTEGANAGGAALRTGIQMSPAVFSAELRAVPHKAEKVQRDLNLSVWNGNVRLTARTSADAGFSKALLREISSLGRKTQEVFEQSIGELHETVVSSIVRDSGFLASLASEQLTRNLYERANDCRWWALNDTLIGALSGRADAGSAARVLRHINGLYTVYHSIVLFDVAGRVVAVSRDDQAHLLGTTVQEPWAAATLALRDSQSHCVSEFEPSEFYGGEPTLVYGAAVFSASRSLVGGVAVVFDSTPQLATILDGVLPRDGAGKPLPGCIAMFLDRGGALLSATDVDAARHALSQAQGHATDSGQAIMRIGATSYAVGECIDPGYREYTGIGARARLLIPLGTAAAVASRSAPPRCGVTRARTDADVCQYTTFAVGNAWYALPTGCVIEAVDAQAVKSMAAAGAQWAGVMTHGNDAVPVADLAALLQMPARGDANIVILVRVPGRAQPLGLRVEALGDNPEVPRERVLPVAARAAATMPPLVELAIQPDDASSALVMVLDARRLAALLSGETVSAEGTVDADARFRA